VATQLTEAEERTSRASDDGWFWWLWVWVGATADVATSFVALRWRSLLIPGTRPNLTPPNSCGSLICRLPFLRGSLVLRDPHFKQP